MTCETNCQWIFGEIKAYPLIRGGTRIEWSLHPQFRDSAPYTFQLQVGRTGNPNADDWEDVGTAVTDVYYLDDNTKRLYGQTGWTHYRLVLSTGQGEYTSLPVNSANTLSAKDLQKLKGIRRTADLRLRKGAGNEGYLLKRRIYGDPCICVDAITKEISIPDCTVCYGTGIVGGYFAPYPCFYVEQVPYSVRTHLSQLGTTNDGPVMGGRMIPEPMVHSYDVWVNKSSDERWFIHQIKTETEIGSVPAVLYPVEMRLAPFSHVIYRLPIIGQQDH